MQFELRGGTLRLGRATSEDPDDKLPITFDPKLSRRLALLEVGPGFLSVQRDQSRHPLFHEGEERERFELQPGQRFSSGETMFELLDDSAQTMTVQLMERLNKSNAEQVLQVLLDFQALLSRWLEPKELAGQSADLLRKLLPGAQVAFFQITESGEKALTSTSLLPSQSLLNRCLDEKLPAFHLWTSAGGSDQPTQFGDESWALAAPILTSQERYVLYALGRQSEDAPGELARGALSLVAQILGQHLEGRRSVLLAAQVKAESQANERLRILLETVAMSVSLQQEDVMGKVILDGARRLTGAEVAHFELDLSPYLDEGVRTCLGQDAEGEFMAMAFENSWPDGLLCRNPEGQAFTAEHKSWLEALMGYAETVFENRRLHQQVHTSLAQIKESQSRMIRSSQWAAAGRLAANASHELNTPLGAIKLSAETALGFLEQGPEPAKKSLELLLRAVERCKKVTARFLVYSRPRREKRPEVFELVAVVEDSLASVSHPMEISKVDVQCQGMESLKVLGDPQDTYWAITNVVKNAVEVLSESEGKRRIKLSTRTKDGQLTLLVEDSGPGVPEDLKEKIFEPFFSTLKIGQGSGLGLAISRRNLRSWGGDLKLGSSELGGACFELHLPLARREQREH